MTLLLRGAPLASLATVLDSGLQRPIVDETGLSGAIDADLTTGRIGDAPGIFAALEE